MDKPGVLVALCFLILSVPLVGQTPYRVDTCRASKNIIGGTLKVTVPDKAVARHGQDVDYQEFSVGFGSGKDRVWMHGIWGPMATSGQVPRDWIDGSESIFTRTWRSDLVQNGIDRSGKRSDGTYWRYLGSFGEAISYHGVNKKAAEYFDQILSTVCFDSTIK